MLERATSQKVKEVLKSKPLYVQIQEKYEEDFEQPALEMRKKQLADIRSFCRPLEKKELEMHTQEYKMLKKQKLEEIKRRRDMQKEELEKHFDSLNYAPHLDEN